MASLCKIAFFMALVMIVYACNQDEVNYTVELCDVYEETGNGTLYLISDAGNTLNTSTALDTAYKPGQRFKVTYIKLEGDNVLKNEATIEVKFMMPVIVKDAVTSSSCKEIFADPLWLIDKPWYGGGYLNFEFSYRKNDAIKIMHDTRLVQDSLAHRKIYMTFGHNAHGDISKKSVTALVSFPLISIPDLPLADSLILNVLEGSNKKVYKLAARR
ncbi:MAG: hypothetical protein M0P26_00300 [Bacteroidales bacterium]|nr:hypothetical protein [Bacteroidales bacterium]